MAIMAASMERSPNFDVKEISIVKELIDAQSGQSASIVGKEVVSIDMSEVEKQEFELLARQLEYDCNAISTFRKKYKDRECAIYHQKLQWSIDQQLQARSIAKTFVEKHVCLHLPEKSEHAVLAAYTEWKSTIVKKLSLGSEKNVVPLECLAYANSLCLT